jgi:integrase
MPRKQPTVLTDDRIRKMKPAKPDQRYEINDALVPGLLVRVNDEGRKSLMFYARWPDKNWSRRPIGEHGAVSIDQAREIARGWATLLLRGVDPRVQEEQERKAKLREQQHTFAAVAEDYIAYIHREGQRKARSVEHELRTHFISKWAERPAADITLHDVRAIIVPVAARAPYQAHTLFGHIRTLYRWAIASGAYGLESSPCDRLQPKFLIGKKRARKRVLNDDELRAFWRATARMGDLRIGGYPWCPLFRLLLLTGQRKTEISDAVWPEVDLDKRLLTIPPERFKSDSTHLCPLSTDAVVLLEALPRWKHPKGEFVFSTTRGAKPVDGFSKAKARLDELMLEELRTVATSRADAAMLARLDEIARLLATAANEDAAEADKDAARKKLKELWWTLHDLRRTVRTRLSWLGVADPIAERVIGHGPRDPLEKVYNRYEFLPERAAALQAWADRLRSIVEPPPTGDNVVKLRSVK